MTPDLLTSAPAPEPQAESPPAKSVAPVSVVILTLNEETNVADCIASCAWCDDVHVLDSGSTDRTCDIARSLGATVHHHPFQSFGEQRNWAIDNIPVKHDWIFHLDADERFTPELVREMADVIESDPPHAGYYVPHKLIFMGRWLRRAAEYPIYQMRLFHARRMRFCDYGHGQRELTAGSVGKLARPYLHYNFSKGVEDWLEKHNRYSTLEARLIFEGQQNEREPGNLWGSSVERRRFFKAKIYTRLPGKWIERFIWSYFVRLGFFDGVPGLHYCLLMSTYELFITLKLRELRRAADAGTPAHAVDARRVADAPATPPAHAHVPPPRRTHPPSPHERSPWTLREKIGRVLWMATQALLFRTSFHNWYGWRRFLLRCFGAKIGKHVRIRPSASIEIPWMLELGDDCVVGDEAILYSLGKITVGPHSVISQYAHLCAGTHDHTTRSFPLMRLPITLGEDCWIAADAFVGPGVTIGDRTILGARASAFSDLPPDVIAVGNPAKPIKARPPVPR